jgi:hypothetical protein
MRTAAARSGGVPDPLLAYADVFGGVASADTIASELVLVHDVLSRFFADHVVAPLRLARDQLDRSEQRIAATRLYFFSSRKAAALCFPLGGGRFGIGITLGLIAQTLAQFHLLLARPDVLPGVGSSITSAIGRERLERSSDPTRRAIADHCAYLALQFVVLHECAHIRRGHLNAALHFGASALEDPEPAGLAGQLPIGAIVYCEWDADEAAARVHPGHISLEIRALSRGWRRFLAPRWFRTFRADPYQYWGFALGILMRMFATVGAQSENTTLERQHPHAMVRLANIRSLLLLESDALPHLDISLPDPSTLAQGAGRGFAAATEAWHAVGGPEPDAEFLLTEARVLREMREEYVDLVSGLILQDRQ